MIQRAIRETRVRLPDVAGRVTETALRFRSRVSSYLIDYSDEPQERGKYRTESDKKVRDNAHQNQTFVMYAKPNGNDILRVNPVYGF